MYKNVTINDVELINNWRNDPETLRLLSFRKEPFTMEITQKWVQDSINNEYCEFFWVDDLLLVRIVNGYDLSTITIYFNPNKRKAALRCLIKQTRVFLPHPPYFETKIENKVIQKLAEGFGFKEVGRIEKKGAKLIQYKKC